MTHRVIHTGFKEGIKGNAISTPSFEYIVNKNYNGLVVKAIVFSEEAGIKNYTVYWINENKERHVYD